MKEGQVRGGGIEAKWAKSEGKNQWGLDAISQGPKSLDFQGPTPSHWP